MMLGHEGLKRIVKEFEKILVQFLVQNEFLEAFLVYINSSSKSYVTCILGSLKI
jgi:hypothetical protein